VAHCNDRSDPEATDRHGTAAATSGRETEDGVIKDARARQRRHRYIGVAIVAMVAVVVALVLGVGGGGGSGTPAPKHVHRGGSKPAVAHTSAPPQRSVSLDDLTNAQAYSAGRYLYVAQQVNRPGRSTVLSELTRVKPTALKVLANRQLGSGFEQALLSHGVLWVTTASGRTEWLWRLDPASLGVIGKQALPGLVERDQDGFGSLAVAGGWLWVGSWSDLFRVSLTSGKITGTRQIPGAHGIDVAADAKGDMLIDSEGDQAAYVQRRNPVSGALLAQSADIPSRTKPHIGGVFGGDVWISVAEGMMGYVGPLSTSTLKPVAFAGAQPEPDVTDPDATIWGTNAVTARVIDGVLWVTAPPGGSKRNYCGSPITGVSRAPLGLGASATVLTVGPGRNIYYVTNGSTDVRQRLARAKMSPRC